MRKPSRRFPLIFAAIPQSSLTTAKLSWDKKPMGSLGGAAVASDKPRAMPRVLVVFDYDESLVNDDSDALFCRTHCPELLARLSDLPPHTAPPNGWPALMDELFGVCFEQNRLLTRDEVERTAGKIAVFPEMLDAVRLAADEYSATVAIVSDANTVFIESMLAHHKLRDQVKEIHTNRGIWEAPRDGGPGARLRVMPYLTPDQAQHGCARCPANMCKGQILDTMRANDAFDAVLYVGDGIGDFCPSTRLTRQDTVFARSNSGDGKSFGLLHRIQAEPEQVLARVVPWSCGRDVYTHFRATLESLVVARYQE